MTPAIDKVKAKKIALISDTHFMKPKGADVPKPLERALAGSDLIVNLGHISSASSMERLAKTAPFLGVRTQLDDRILGGALEVEIASGRVASYARVIEASGVRIGCVHNLSMLKCGVTCGTDGRMKFGAKAGLAGRLAKAFGGPVDVVAFANTHIEVVAYADGVLFVNPGSPNLPGGAREGGPGTIAMLTLSKGAAQVDIVEVPKK
jgi:putative phosphoesterase